MTWLRKLFVILVPPLAFVVGRGEPSPTDGSFLVPEAGHRSWLDQPERVTSALQQFFRGEWPAEAIANP